MHQKSILIVDDEEDIRDLLSYNLKKAGFNVDVASNGKDCLSKLKSNKPNLILLDVMMPEMDGLEVCEEIKSESTNADILICFLKNSTGNGQEISGTHKFNLCVYRDRPGRGIGDLSY